MADPSATVSSRQSAGSTHGADGPMMVAIHDMHKVYDSGENAVHAVRGLDLEVPMGQFISIMGASGSGKSTLLNILGALDVPTRGTYCLAGRMINTLNRNELAALRNQYIGFIFQNFNLLLRSSAVENVELPMVYAGVPARQRRRAALAALDRVHLADRANHLPTQLSGGQQQRVAIARSLANSPRLLLADEPTGNLDTHTSSEIMRLLQDLYRDEKLTIILVTHDCGLASFSERVIVLRDGRIVADQATPRCGGPEIPDVRALVIKEGAG